MIRLALWVSARIVPVTNSFHAFPQDVRYALRGLLAAPGFVLGVVLSLSIGIGANVVAFSFINAAVFRPFPGVDRQHELVRLSLGGRKEFSTQQPDYAHFNLDTARQRLTTVRSVSGSWSARFAVSTGEQAWSVPGALVSSNYFDVLGVQPAAGRFFVAAEDAPASPVAVISDAAWERFFARDPAAVGRTLSVNGATLEIIGIAPADFTGVRKSSDKPALWIPLGQATLTLRDAKGNPAGLRMSRGAWPDYVGRRRADVSLEQVQIEASVLAAQVGAATGKNVTAMASRVWLNDPAESAPAVLGFMAIPMLVLAIACVNAANLMLARAARQARDWTVRLALGASRWRVVRQVLTEAALLAAGAAALGFALGRWAVGFAASQVPVPIPADWRVAFFTIAIALFTAVAFSLGPALGVTSRAGRRLPPASTMAGASRSRARFALVALQAALSLGLLTTGAQFTRTVFASNPREAQIPDPQLLVMTTIDLDPLRFTPEAGEAFYQRLVDRVRRVPGVSGAGSSTTGLVRGSLGDVAPARLWLPDSPPEGKRGFIPMQVSPGALSAIGMPLLQGRHFAEADARALRAVVVNQVFAKHFLAGAPLGRSFRLGATAGDAVDVTVIGVTDGIMKRGGQEPALLYHPAPIGYQPTRTLYIRADRTGAFTVSALQAAVREVDSRVPLGDPITLNDARGGLDVERRLFARAAAGLGMAALLLAAFGLYSVVSYVVSLRRQEVGIRLALGADAASVVTMIVRQALTPTLIGAAVGAAAAAAAGKVIQSQLYGTASVDPLVFLATGLLMVLVMAAASWIPARQAGRVDPLQVLRTE
ncbi:MAG TPA: ABC transporter permease [Vicinamibacterales bacterium]|nr:ABC transporter permease [Vicinamibacterales bacterium]